MDEPDVLQDSKPMDPRRQGPEPEFPQKPIEPPGLDSELTPTADHGEQSYRGLGRIEGRIALITGGDSGIGRAVAIAFAREGADVAISYLPEEEGDAQETKSWVEDAKRRVLLLPGDIQQESVCLGLVNAVFDTFGGLDILVNNAAYQRTHDAIEEFTTEELERTFRLGGRIPGRTRSEVSLALVSS